MATQEEVAATEQRGDEWRAYSDSFLIGYLVEREPQNQNIALAEMQRRQVAAIREFNEQSGRQAAVMIRWTIVITVLTVVVGLIAGGQLWQMLKGGA